MLSFVVELKNCFGWLLCNFLFSIEVRLVVLQVLAYVSSFKFYCY